MEKNINLNNIENSKLFEFDYNKKNIENLNKNNWDEWSIDKELNNNNFNFYKSWDELNCNNYNINIIEESKNNNNSEEIIYINSINYYSYYPIQLGNKYKLKLKYKTPINSYLEKYNFLKKHNQNNEEKINKNNNFINNENNNEIKKEILNRDFIKFKEPIKIIPKNLNNIFNYNLNIKCPYCGDKNHNIDKCEKFKNKKDFCKYCLSKNHKEKECLYNFNEDKDNNLNNLLFCVICGKIGHLLCNNNLKNNYYLFDEYENEDELEEKDYDINQNDDEKSEYILNPINPNGNDFFDSCIDGVFEY